MTPRCTRHMPTPGDASTRACMQARSLLAKGRVSIARKVIFASRLTERYILVRTNANDGCRVGRAATSSTPVRHHDQRLFVLIVPNWLIGTPCGRCVATPPREVAIAMRSWWVGRKDTGAIHSNPSGAVTDPPETSDVHRIPPVAPGRLPGIGHLAALLRDRLAFMKSLPALANVVRIYLGRRPMYVLNSHELVRTIMVSEAGKCRRGVIFEKAGKVLGKGLICAEGEAHRQQRRLLQPAFHQQPIGRYSTVMIEVAAAESRSWEPGQAFDVNSRMHDLGLEMQCRALFRTEFAAGAAARVKQATSGMMAGIAAQALYPAQWLEKLPLPVNRRFNAALPQMRKAVNEIIASYRKAGIVEGDVLAMLMTAQDQETGHGMSDEQLRDEVINLMAAGSEAVPPTLSWVFHELALHPDVEQLLVEELIAELGEEPVSFEDLTHLKYTSAVLNEVLRLHPPTWILMRRAEHSLNLGEFQIPAGAEVAFSPTALHLDPAMYDDPLRFDPLRWLDGRTANLPHTAYMPFGMGKHRCLGEAFAITEVLVAVATIARQWRLIHKPGTRVRELPWATVQPGGLIMYPVAR